MKAQRRYLAYLIVTILVLAMLGAEACFAGDIQLATVSLSTQKYPYSANYNTNNYREGLDLESLERRVRNSSALGFFDKIKLKFEVDELIQVVSDFHHGKSNDSVKALRARFEGVLSKAFELLQKDTELRQELSSSRETLWKMLLDPVQFAKR